jgi:hypothetical protein
MLATDYTESQTKHFATKLDIPQQTPHTFTQCHL